MTKKKPAKKAAAKKPAELAEHKRCTAFAHFTPESDVPGPHDAQQNCAKVAGHAGPHESPAGRTWPSE